MRTEQNIVLASVLGDRSVVGIKTYSLISNGATGIRSEDHCVNLQELANDGSPLFVWIEIQGNGHTNGLYTGHIVLRSK